MKLDLHVHTTASDGSWTPGDVVRGAAEGGLDVLALADHDTTAGVAEAVELGRELRVQVIPALEVSSTHEGRDVHVLGYFVDLSAPPLREHEQQAKGRRDQRMREMLQRLRGLGIEVAYEAVLEAAGPEGVVLGRPHLAQALVAGGHVPSVQVAFDTLIGDGGPGFVPTHMLTPMDAVEIIRGSGGMAVWAHPPGDLVDGLLRPLMDAGLAGLEVYRPRNRRDQTLRLEKICRSTGLLATGGSDWHGPEGGTALGDFWVSGDEVQPFLEAGGL